MKTNTTITYQTNDQLWSMKSLLENIGFTQEADCYWTQIFTRGNDEVITVIREEDTTNDPMADLRTALNFDVDETEEEEEFEITAIRRWDRCAVRQACIRNDLYTSGSCRAYEAMLDMVRDLEPTHQNLYRVAKDIWSHSDDQTITNIMYILEREAVYTTFELDGRDDI